MSLGSLLLPLLACQSGASGVTGPDPSPAPTGAPTAAVIVVSPSDIVLAPGSRSQLTASVRDERGRPVSGYTFAWSSTDPEIVTVSAGGLAEGRRAGSAEVTVEAQGEGSGLVLRDEATVRVSSASSPAQPPPPSAPPPPSQSTGHPNEPAGMTPATERSFDAMIEDGWWWNGSNGNPSGNLKILSDPTAPVSAPSVLQIRYPAGFGGGKSPYRHFGKSVRGHRWKEIYVSYWIQFSSNWYGHPKSGVNKMVYIPQAGFASNPLYVIAEGTKSGPLTLQVRTQDPRFRNRNLSVNRGTGRIRRGSWHQIEVYARFNSGSNSDGVVRFWLDGSPAGDYSNVQLSTGNDSKVWSVVKFDAVWGGTGQTVPQDQYLRIDHAYVSGR
ncbi:MAG: Ig-like domain-containing protein [Gemmatimonadota bacterium]